MSRPHGVYFGLSVDGVDTPVLAVMTESRGALALHEVVRLDDLCELPKRIRPWTRSDIESNFCTDAAITLDYAGPQGERRIDHLYRKLFPQEFEAKQWISRLPAVRAASMRGLQAARFAHEMGLRIAETHPRACLSWLGMRDPRWQRWVSEYGARRFATSETQLVPAGIVHERCTDLWNGLVSRYQILDLRVERFPDRDLEIDAVVCALAACALTNPFLSSAIFPWNPNDCLIGAQGSYVVLGRGGKAAARSETENSTGSFPQSSSSAARPKRAA